jgi:hypothetical protein
VESDRYAGDFFFWTSVPPMEEEFNQIGGGASIETICAEGAMEAMLDGRPEKHNQLVAVQADNLSECNVVMSLQPRNFEQCLRSLIDPCSPALIAPSENSNRSYADRAFLPDTPMPKPT